MPGFFFFFNKGYGDRTLHAWAVSTLQTKLSLQAQTKGSRKNRAVTKWISAATIWKRNQVWSPWISVWEPGVSGSKTLLTAFCVWRKDEEQRGSNKICKYQKAWENLWGEWALCLRDRAIVQHAQSPGFHLQAWPNKWMNKQTNK